MDPRTGAVEEVADGIDGTPMRFCNNAAIAGDGTVWFSDSSTKFGIEQWKDDFVQNTRTGRLARLGTDGAIEVVIDGLAFANGVALPPTSPTSRSPRPAPAPWCGGGSPAPKAGTRDFLVTDLPGYPDNIARGSDGLIWVSIASPKDAFVERLQRAPGPVRRAVTKIPERLQPKPKRTIRAQAYDDAGTLVHDIDLPDSTYHMVTGVREHDGRLWLGSLHEPAVAVIDALNP